MDLTVKTRQKSTKSTLKAMRREKNIPGIIYSKGSKGLEVEVDGIAFQKVLNTLEKGTLSSCVFDLDIEGKKIKAIIKEIQYHPTTYQVIHLDFEELHDEVPVTLNIPIQFVNALDCTGVKLGGVLRQVMRKLKVRCLPKDIPSHFELDVLDLKMGQSLKLNKIKIPSGVQPLMDLKELVVVVAKR